MLSKQIAFLISRSVRLGLSLAVITSVAFAQGTAKAPKPKITPGGAAKVAQAKYPGKVKGKVVLENEDGKWQYEVIIVKGKVMHEVNVDAMTGKINSVEVVTAKEEAKEKKAEAKKKG